MDIKKIFHGSVQKRITLEPGVTDLYAIHHTAESGLLQIFPHLFQKIFAEIRYFSAQDDKRRTDHTDKVSQSKRKLSGNLIHHGKSHGIPESGCFSKIGKGYLRTGT